MGGQATLRRGVGDPGMGGQAATLRRPFPGPRGVRRFPGCRVPGRDQTDPLRDRCRGSRIHCRQRPDQDLPLQGLEGGPHRGQAGLPVPGQTRPVPGLSGRRHQVLQSRGIGGRQSRRQRDGPSRSGEEGEPTSIPGQGRLDRSHGAHLGTPSGDVDSRAPQDRDRPALPAPGDQGEPRVPRVCRTVRRRRGDPDQRGEVHRGEQRGHGDRGPGLRGLRTPWGPGAQDPDHRGQGSGSETQGLQQSDPSRGGRSNGACQGARTSNRSASGKDPGRSQPTRNRGPGCPSGRGRRRDRPLGPGRRQAGPRLPGGPGCAWTNGLFPSRGLAGSPGTCRGLGPSSPAAGGREDLRGLFLRGDLEVKDLPLGGFGGEVPESGLPGGEESLHQGPDPRDQRRFPVQVRRQGSFLQEGPQGPAVRTDGGPPGQQRHPPQDAHPDVWIPPIGHLEPPRYPPALYSNRSYWISISSTATWLSIPLKPGPE